MGKHAFLSASSSPRWTACPPSAKLCAEVDDKSSPYAMQGTDAHELAAYEVEHALGHNVRDPTEDLDYYDEEMQMSIDGYRDFVMEKVEEVKAISEDVQVFVEERLDYSRWVPGGFGTGDCVIITQGLLHVIDLKYGIGVLVSASGEDGYGNPQLMCYALGALDTYDALYNIERVVLSIYQPRRENVDTFELTKEALLKWADEVLSPAAALAAEGKGEFRAGSHCQFCKIKATCRERSYCNMELAKYDFLDPAVLSTDEIADILSRLDGLISWAGDLKDYALQAALNGTRFEGFKVVEGRSTRKYTDENAVAKIVSEAGFDPYEKKLRGITAMTEELGKKTFNTLLGGLIYKPQGKPVLVRSDDKRPEMNTATMDFKNMEE